MRSLLKLLVLGVLATLGIAAVPGSAAGTGEPAIWGTVTDASGAPITGANVRIQASTYGDCDGSNQSSPCWAGEDLTADAAGRYQGVVDGYGLYRPTFAVSVSADGFASEYAVDLTGGQHDVVLEPGTPGFEPITVEGTVTDSAGAPVAGTWVAPIDPYGPIRGGAPTDAAGRYTFTFDATGNAVYRLSVGVDSDNDGVAEASSAILGSSPGSPPFGPGAVYVEDLVIPGDDQPDPPVTVRGVVLDAAGNPAPGVVYGIGDSLSESQPNFNQITDVYGRFEFSYRAGEVADRYTFHPDVPGEDVSVSPGGHAPGDVVDVQVDLSVMVGDYQQHGLIRGRVVDEDGAPAPGVGVHLDDETYPARSTSYDGSFQATVPADIARSITLKMNGVVRGSGGPYTVTGGETREVELALQPVAEEPGRIVDGSGRPVAGADVVVTLVNEGSGDCATTQPDYWLCRSAHHLTTDADGRYSVASWDVAGATVSVTADGFVSEYVRDVTGDAPGFVLEPGVSGFAPVTVTGVVRNLAGEPMPGVRTRFSDATGQLVTDPDGRYSITLDPFAYYLDPDFMPSLQAFSSVGEMFGSSRVVPADGGPLDPGDVVTLDLEIDGATIFGTVRNAGGSPAPNTMVSIRRTDREYWFSSVSTDEAGRYVVAVAPGSYRFDVHELSAPMPAVPLAEATVASNDELELDVTLPAAPGRPAMRTARAISPNAAKVFFTRAAEGPEAAGFNAVCFRPGGVGRRVASGVASPVEVSGLRPGRAYHCRVRAGNASGVSGWSAWSAWFRTPAK